MTALSALTPEGKLYEIDARLRPSGNSSPLASEATGFAEYQNNDAWTWEHMALTRARTIAGSPALGEFVAGVIRDVLAKPRDAAALVGDVASMRLRIDKERRTENLWKLKHVRGGLLDIEFIAQYLELREAADRPELLSQETDKVFERLAESGIMAAGDAAELGAATHLLRRLQSLLRLTVGVSRDENLYPTGLRDALAQAAEVENFDEVRAKLLQTQERVRAYYDRYVQQPADAEAKE